MGMVRPEPMRGGNGMDNVAIVTFSKDEGRYELRIGGKLKAYTNAPHEKNKPALEKLATDKGYKIEEG